MKISTSPQRITPRHPVPTAAELDEFEPAQRYLYFAMRQAAAESRRLRMVAEDKSRPVDEYSISTSTETQSTVEVLPQFEFFSERIEAILITCNPPQTVTVQLGDRQWPVIVPASGIVVIAPISMLLDRNMRRIATTSPAAELTMELMGWADERY